LRAAIARTVDAARSLGWSPGQVRTLNERSVSPYYRCNLPPTSLFGIELANNTFATPSSSEHVTETVGLATTTDPVRAAHLYENSSRDYSACVSATPPRRIASYPNAQSSRVRPFEVAIGWAGYAPPKRFNPPELGPVGTFEGSGLTFGGKNRWIFYSVLRDGYVVAVTAQGSMAPHQVATFVGLLARSL
jgi:hypothetical protein